MARFLTLALLAALAVAEVAAVLWLVNAIGPGAAMLVLMADMFAGLLVMRWGAGSPPGVRGFRLAAGGFISLPGLVLDVVGLALLLPPVQAWVRGHLMRTTEGMLGRSGISVVRVTSRDVVAGSVIPDDAPTTSGPSQTPGGVPWPPTAPPSPSAGTPTDRSGSTPDSGPRVIRGEIESGE